MTKVETIEQYFELAPRTLVRLSCLEEDLFHMTTGYKTEIGEIIDVAKKNVVYKKTIDEVNLLEEVGDFVWYLASNVKIIGETYPEFDLDKFFKEVQDKKEFSVEKFENHEIEVLNEPSHIWLREKSKELQKSVVFMYIFEGTFNAMTQGKLTKQSFIEVMFNFSRAFVESLGYDFLEVLTKNINKLEARYPEKFTEENALNRDLKKERDILES